MLIGRVVAQPELRYTQSGKPVATFRMAVDRRGGGRGNEKSEADFIGIKAWDRLAEICNEYLSKGKLIAIRGRLETRSYEDKDGNKRSAFDVVADEMSMLSTGDGAGGGGGGSRGSGEARRVPNHGPRKDWDDGDREPAGVGSSKWGNDGFEDVGVDDVPF